MLAINVTVNNLASHRSAILRHVAQARLPVETSDMYEADYKSHRNDQETCLNTETEEILNIYPTGKRNVG